MSMSLASLPIGSIGGTQQVKNKSVMFIDNTVSTQRAHINTLQML